MAFRGDCFEAADCDYALRVEGVGVGGYGECFENVFHEFIFDDFFDGCSCGVDVHVYRELVLRDPFVVFVFEVVFVEGPAISEWSVIYQGSCGLCWFSVCP